MTKIEVADRTHAERIREALAESNLRALTLIDRPNRGWAVYTPAARDAAREVLVERHLLRGAIVGDLTDATALIDGSWDEEVDIAGLMG